MPQFRMDNRPFYAPSQSGFPLECPFRTLHGSYNSNLPQKEMPGEQIHLP